MALRTEDQSARHRWLLSLRYPESVGATFTHSIAYHNCQKN
jgi:hypothetical protein